MKKQKQNSLARYKKILIEGTITNNPTFIQLLGMCSTLAITTSVFNGLGMGFCVTFVLIFSNLFISVLRRFIPRGVRIASYVVIIAGFVTVIDLLMKAYVPDLSKSLGLFIPLIVVNCVILARAESFASKNTPLPSAFDGFSMGLGFTGALVMMSVVRELFGNGTLCGIQIMPDGYEPAVLFVSPAGGFLVLGFLVAFVQFFTARIRITKGEHK